MLSCEVWRDFEIISCFFTLKFIQWKKRHFVIAFKQFLKDKLVVNLNAERWLNKNEHTLWTWETTWSEWTEIIESTKVFPGQWIVLPDNANAMHRNNLNFFHLKNCQMIYKIVENRLSKKVKDNVREYTLNSNKHLKV